MINVQKNLAGLNPLFRNRVVGIKRVQYWTPVSLEGKQVTIFLLARVKNDTLTAAEFHRQLLRLVYRLLFLMVAEERRMIVPESPEADALQLFARLANVARKS